MKEQKTLPNNNSVSDFLALIEDEQKKEDAYTLLALCQERSGFPPLMWGTSIIGFGSYHYVYPSRHEGDAPLISFAVRSKNFSIYTTGTEVILEELLPRLGKHKMGVGCLYINRLSDINISILEEIIDESIKVIKELYG